MLAPLMAPPERRSSAASFDGAPFVTFTQVADGSTVIPDGVGAFTNFPYEDRLKWRKDKTYEKRPSNEKKPISRTRLTR
jgi:hypothetical protein